MLDKYNFGSYRLSATLYETEMQYRFSQKRLTEFRKWAQQTRRCSIFRPNSTVPYAKLAVREFECVGTQCCNLWLYFLYQAIVIIYWISQANKIILNDSQIWPYVVLFVFLRITNVQFIISSFSTLLHFLHDQDTCILTSHIVSLGT
jgi:hypothetical protein